MRARTDRIGVAVGLSQGKVSEIMKGAVQVIVNAHGGNYVLSNVVRESSATGAMALFPSREDWQDARNAAQPTSSMHEDMHAYTKNGVIGRPSLATAE
jgi:creatinine amidohydrolase/Fe(II)-dependent formamide hydrolase-like protein